MEATKSDTVDVLTSTKDFIRTAILGGGAVVGDGVAYNCYTTNDDFDESTMYILFSTIYSSEKMIVVVM